MDVDSHVYFFDIRSSQIGGEIVEHHRAEMNLRNKALIVLLCMIGTDVILRGYVLRRFIEYTLPQDASPCTKLLSESERRRMHCCESVELFLSADYELPEDAFNWWKVRRHLTRKQSQPFTGPTGLFVSVTIGCYHTIHNRCNSKVRFVCVSAFTA